MTESMTRKTVPLTGTEVSLIEQARTAGTPYHAALTQFFDEDVTRSEAATLHALVTYSLNMLGEQVALDGYAHLAASRNSEDEEYATMMRRRARDR